MKKEISLIKFLFIILDFFLFFLALNLALSLRFGFNFSLYLQEYLNPFLLLFPFYLLLLFSFNLYDFYFLNLKTLFLRIFYFSFSALILSIVYFYFGQTIFKISPKTNLLIFLFSFILFLAITRFLALKIFQKRKALVYFLGREEMKRKLSKDLGDHPFFIFQGNWQTNSFQNLDKLSILVTDPNYHLKAKEFQSILNSEIAVFDFIDFYERFFGRIPLEAVTSDWLIRQITTGQTKIYFYFKRFFDLLLSTFLFIFLFLPLFLPISILIFLFDPGSIFFKQSRVGYKRKIFELIKFRTMRQNKETEGKWAVGNEEKRIFLFGKFLRKTHLDELPQIFNLFKGELTLVGPRPEQPKIFEDLEKEIPFYEVRVLLPPGLTGWAQVNYKYPENLEETKVKLEYDLYYLKNDNLFLDFLILIKTLQKILTF
jgi:lipopolysaccharide/colanic/teichoic acid biosynthesis glycosyltransferase